MAQDDWHRRPTWTDVDRDAFFTRLARCRSDSTRTQALRIQAITLQNNGYPDAAIQLLNQLLAEHPEDYFRGLTLQSRAACYATLGQTDAALADLRETLRVQREDCPNVATSAWLDLSWMIVQLELEEDYEEAIETLAWGEAQQSLTFPVSTYMCEAVKAIVSKARGDSAGAFEHATRALEAATRTHSGIARHPTIGIVGETQIATTVHEKLQALVSP